MREADNEELPYVLIRHLPFGQDFEFVVRRGEFRGKLDELEAIMFPEERSLDLVLQIDRAVRGLGRFLSEAMGTDESYVRITVTEDEAARGSPTLLRRLEEPYDSASELHRVAAGHAR